MFYTVLFFLCYSIITNLATGICQYAWTDALCCFSGSMFCVFPLFYIRFTVCGVSMNMGCVSVGVLVLFVGVKGPEGLVREELTLASGHMVQSHHIAITGRLWPDSDTHFCSVSCSVSCLSPTLPVSPLFPLLPSEMPVSFPASEWRYVRSCLR